MKFTELDQWFKYISR